MGLPDFFKGKTGTLLLLFVFAIKPYPLCRGTTR
jgi:hypothetical protein